MNDEKTKLAHHATMLRERAATIKNELQLGFCYSSRTSTNAKQSAKTQARNTLHACAATRFLSQVKALATWRD